MTMYIHSYLALWGQNRNENEIGCYQLTCIKDIEEKEQERLRMLLILIIS